MFLRIMVDSTRPLVQRQKNRGRFRIANDRINLPATEFLAVIHLFRALFNARSVQPLMLVMAASRQPVLHLQKQIDISHHQQALVDRIVERFRAYERRKATTSSRFAADRIRRELFLQHLLFCVSDEVVRLHQLQKQAAVAPVLLIHVLPCVAEVLPVRPQMGGQLLYASTRQLVIQRRARDSALGRLHLQQNLDLRPLFLR